MMGSVERTKSVEGAGRSAKPAKPSADALLKQAVSGAAVAKHERRPFVSARNGRYAAVATGALVVGVALGMMSAPKPSSSDALAAIAGSVEGGRAQTARLAGEVETLGRTLAALTQSAGAARDESRALDENLSDRLSKLEQGIDRRFVGLTEVMERSERDQSARIAGLAAQADKRGVPQPATLVSSAATATPSPKQEPMQTGSLAETKPKVETVDSWAVREVYNGMAMLEDRKRRLIEVAPGETIPGVGRVESIEHRGRLWVVVTKQGVITPQTW